MRKPVVCKACDCSVKTAVIKGTTVAAAVVVGLAHSCGAKKSGSTSNRVLVVGIVVFRADDQWHFCFNDDRQTTSHRVRPLANDYASTVVRIVPLVEALSTADRVRRLSYATMAEGDVDAHSDVLKQHWKLRKEKVRGHVDVLRNLQHYNSTTEGDDAADTDRQY